MQYSTLNLLLTLWKIFHNLEKMQNFRFSVTFSIQRCCFWANVYIAPFADRVFIFGANDAIGVQIGIGIQEIRPNMLHHPTEKVPQISGFWPTLWKWAGLEACH